MSADSGDNVRIDTNALFGAVWYRAVRIGVVTLVLLVLTFVILMFVPRVYESNANILIEPRDSIFLRATNEASAGVAAPADDVSVASEIELVQSRDTLLYVIEQENLAAEPEFSGAATSPIALVLQAVGLGGSNDVDLQERVLANVTDGLTVLRERDSRVISIIFKSEDPALAARVANAIAQAHIDRRAGLVISDTADATRWLEVEIDKMRARVNEAEAKVAAYKVENDLFTSGDNVSLLDQQLSDIASQISAAQERKSAAESRAMVLRGLIKSGQPIESVQVVRESPSIQAILEEKGRLQSERAQRLATLLPNHPEVRALTSQIAEVDKQVVIEGRRVAEALDAEAEVEADVERALRDELARLKVDASGATQSSVALAELEREAKAQRDLLETYLLRYRDASARTESNSALPDVRVVSVAAPSVEPASPKVPLILLAVAIVSVSGQVGHILFSELLSGRSLIEVEPVRRRRPRRADEDYEATDEYDEEVDEDEFERPQPRRRPRRHVERNPYGSRPQHQDDRAWPQNDWSPKPKWENPLSAMRDRAHQRQMEAMQRELMRAQVQQAYAQQWAPAPASVDPNATAYPGVPAQESYPSPQPVGYEAPVAAPRGSSAIPSDMVALASAVAAGRERIVFISTLGDERETETAIRYLTDHALSRGLSVAVVDGASGANDDRAGLTDLCAGDAGFGDIVYRGRRSNTAEVPWGTLPRLDHRSTDAVTLAEALADIYEVVLIATGRPGIASSLPLFAGVDGLVLVASPFELDEDTLEGIETDAAALDFTRLQVIALDDSDQQVA